MWFIIRATFCVGVVFSMAPEPQTNGAAAPSLADTLAAPAMRSLVDGALTTCNKDPKFCFDMAQRLAGLEESVAAAKAPAAGTARVTGDTLTTADRAAPWHGAGKGSHAATRARATQRPMT